MCTELIVWPDTERSKLIEGQGQLTEFIGSELLFVKDAPKGARDPNGCLCWVDLKAIGKRKGFEVESDGVFYYWRDPEAAKPRKQS